jgi:hypothetical protein
MWYLIATKHAYTVGNVASSCHEKRLYRSNTLPISWISNQRFELVAYINVEFVIQNFAWQRYTRCFERVGTLHSEEYGAPSGLREEDEHVGLLELLQTQLVK